MKRALTIIFCLMALVVQAGGAKPAGLAPASAFSWPVETTFTPPEFIPTSVDSDSVIFQATFETSGGMDAWTSVDLTNPGATWHRDNYNAYNGFYSYWSGKVSLSGYDNNWLQYLDSDTFSLAGSTNPLLTFRLYWSVEPPDGPFPSGYNGWDGCNVWIWNGFTWQVLSPNFPVYNSTSLYSFGWEWGMGQGIPGWTGSSGWTAAEFDLTPYIFYQNLRLRFAFCSDQSNCTAENSNWTGFFVDDILVSQGSTVYLSDNADGNPSPGPSTFSTGTPFGDYWVLTTPQSHSPTHSWNCDDRFFLSDAFVSPPINIPAGMSTALSYWVYCDMPDFNGDHDAYLDDYYFIEVAPVNSAIWTPIAYDYARPGSPLQWDYRADGIWNNLPVPVLSLTPWAGQTVKLRFRTVTDGNNDGGSGSGLYIDDVILASDAIPNNDVGAYRLIIPFPTYQGQVSVAGSVQLINYGLISQSEVGAWWAANGQPQPLIPFPTIPTLDTVPKSFAWTPPVAGNYSFKAYTHLSDDQVPSNDTCSAGIVEVTPAGTFELGYDHRQLTYLPENTLIAFTNFSNSSGAMVHFTPEADGIPGNLFGNTIKAMFRSTGTFRLHIFANGLFGAPGAEVYNSLITVESSQLYPDWKIINLSQVSYLQGGDPDFWVWLEIISPDNTPFISGYLQDAFSSGHFFISDGVNTQSTVVDFNIRATLTGTLAVQPIPPPQPHDITLFTAYPNPFNPATVITYNLPAPAQVNLCVFDLNGRLIANLVNTLQLAGHHEARFDGSGVASGVYLYKLKAGEFLGSGKLVLLK
jgi:hypothetical protein